MGGFEQPHIPIHTHPSQYSLPIRRRDCCAMTADDTHRTNEELRVVGMHAVNFLGTHIVDASLPEHGSGGSWCTCHLSSPEDVCHRQFGARTAFKLAWCSGTRVLRGTQKRLDWG